MTDLGFRFESSYTDLPQIFFYRCRPEAVESPSLILFNEKLADQIGLDTTAVKENKKADFMSGNMLPDGADTFAQAYAGHQFGQFTILGDGRAHVLGEHIAPDGSRFDIQFKGSGRTLYSRRGDGRAALGPMLREYIISEAMANLGIPTTRSLAVTRTGQTVMRESPNPGAVLTRVAPSHIRVGTFEFAAVQQDLTVRKALLDYTIQRHFPEIAGNENEALSLLKAVMDKQIFLITQWMRVGFIHGVMNTDNMALSGHTIDYGPCAFKDEYDPATVFSSIDFHGRYSYANQPVIAQWNLARFAETLLPFIDEDIEKAAGRAEEMLNEFPAIYKDSWLNMMRGKLGLQLKQDEDISLVQELLTVMKETRADYTNTFRDLSLLEKPPGSAYKTKTFSAWWDRWQKRLQMEKAGLAQIKEMMLQHNPQLVPRNHKVEEVLKAADNDDTAPLEVLLSALENPYVPKHGRENFQSPPEPQERVFQTFCGT